MRLHSSVIRVVVAKDQGMVLGALAALLALKPDVEVVGCAPAGLAAWTLLPRERPDVLLPNIEMPGLTRREPAARIQADRLPERVLIATTSGRPGYPRRALDAGVCGYLLKDQPSEELAAAVRQVVAGRRVVAQELAEAASGSGDPLSERERAVLRLAEEGHSNKDIANTLRLAHGTVRNYLHEAVQKLGADNRLKATRTARANGWL